MNDKLRLLVTGACNRKCALCCNKVFDLQSIPVVEHLNYKEIMITGGEPLLFVDRIFPLVKDIRDYTRKKGIDLPKIYLYTAIANWMRWLGTTDFLDGIVLTLHEQSDVKSFLELNKFIHRNYLSCPISLRLNVFDHVVIPDGTDLSMWRVKVMAWQKDCPVPEGEDFRRIKELW